MKSKPKPRQKTLSQLKKDAWTIFSRWIRNRDNWTCYTCGHHEESHQMHAGHFITRNRASTRYDEMNVHAQCLRCNFWDGGNVGVYAERLIKEYGKERFDDLVKRSLQLKQWKESELQELLTKYKI